MRMTRRYVKFALICGLSVVVAGWALNKGNVSAAEVDPDIGPGVDPWVPCEIECGDAQEPVDCPAHHIIPNKSLFITDVCVVDDPCRTRWDLCEECGCDASVCGAWTFGKLMASIAGYSSIDEDPHGLSDFVMCWLDQFRNDTTVCENNTTVPARVTFYERLVERWWAVSFANGLTHLDMRNAPFRLLGVVNRLDLRGPEAGSYGGGSNAGEGRFVFGILDPDLAHPQDPTKWHETFNGLRGTVILEYHLPAQTCQDVLDWAKRWRALSDLPFGPEFNRALQEITDAFAGPFVGNTITGSALAQLRTNEIINFDVSQSGDENEWELREFQVLPCDCVCDHLACKAERSCHCCPQFGKYYESTGLCAKLVQTTVEQTVDLEFDGTADLTDYVLHDLVPIVLGQHVIPLFHPLTGDAFRAGSSINRGDQFHIDNPAGSPSFAVSDFVWSVPDFECSEPRFNFAILNCSGCHAADAGLMNAGAAHRHNFVHVDVRSHNQESILSRFLVGDTNGVEDLSCDFLSPVPNTHGLWDPNVTPPFKLGPPPSMVGHIAVTRYMNDLHRRSLDLCDLLSRTCDTDIIKAAFTDDLGVDKDDEVEIFDIFISRHRAGNRPH